MCFVVRTLSLKVWNARCLISLNDLLCCRHIQLSYYVWPHWLQSRFTVDFRLKSLQIPKIQVQSTQWNITTVTTSERSVITNNKLRILNAIYHYSSWNYSQVVVPCWGLHKLILALSLRNREFNYCITHNRGMSTWQKWWKPGSMTPRYLFRKLWKECSCRSTK